MDMVRGLSGFCESMFGEPEESDPNNFCCMLRTLVAIYKEGGSEGEKREGLVQEWDAMPQTRIYINSSLVVDDVVGIYPPHNGVYRASPGRASPRISQTAHDVRR